MLQGNTFDFLKKLKKNNNKAWFEANKAQYVAAKADFEHFVSQIIEGFSKYNPAFAELQAKQCVFRLNRDVRFSKNKDPYKTNFGASINVGGKKSSKAGFYLHVEPGNCFVGGGIYMPMPDVLAKIRQEIDYNAKEFDAIVKHKSFSKMYSKGLDTSDALKNVPKGYEKDNPAAEYLKLKSFIAIEKITDDVLQQKSALKQLLDYDKALHGLFAFLNRALAE